MTSLIVSLLINSVIAATLNEINHLSININTTTRIAVDEINSNIFAANNIEGRIDIISYKTIDHESLIKTKEIMMIRKSINIKSASKAYFDLNDITDISYSSNGYVMALFTSSTTSSFGWLGRINTTYTKQGKFNDIRFLELKECYTPKYIKPINNGDEVIIGCDGKPNQHGSIIVINIYKWKMFNIDLAEYINKLNDEKIMDKKVKPFNIVIDDKDEFAYITFKGNNVVAILDILLLKLINIYHLDYNNNASPNLLIDYTRYKNGKQYLLTVNEAYDIYPDFKVWEIIIDSHQNIPLEIKLMHSNDHNLGQIESYNASKPSSISIGTGFQGNKYVFIGVYNDNHSGIAIYEMNNTIHLAPKFVEYHKYVTNQPMILNVISQENKDPFLIVVTSTLSQQSLITVYQLNTKHSSSLAIQKCADLVQTVTFWGRNATGIVIDAFTTNHAISFIGCNVACTAPTFECNDTTNSITFSSPNAEMDLLWGPIDTAPTDLVCANASNPQRIQRAMDDEISVTALCQQLGYESGTFIESTYQQGCPKPQWNGTQWTLNFTDSYTRNGARSITCSRFRLPQASCMKDMGDGCGELICENSQCCIPANYNGADCLDDDGNCCDGLICAKDGKCKNTL